MVFNINPYIALPIAGIMVVVATALWYVLVRPVPILSGEGMIKSVELKGEEEVERSYLHIGRSVETGPRDVSYILPDRYEYQIMLDGYSSPIIFSIPKTGESEFKVGERVVVTYYRRQIPLIGTRFYIQNISKIKV